MVTHCNGLNAPRKAQCLVCPFWATEETVLYYAKTLNQHYVEIGICLKQQHLKFKSQVCNKLSDLIERLTTNKTHDVTTMLSVENLYLEVNMYVTL